MIICNTQKMLPDDPVFLQKLKTEPTRFSAMPKLISTTAKEKQPLPNAIFELSAILSTSDIEDKGVLTPETHTGESLEKMAKAITATYKPTDVAIFYMLDTSFLQTSRYYLYVVAKKIVERAESIEMSKQQPIVSQDSPKKEIPHEAAIQQAKKEIAKEIKVRATQEAIEKEAQLLASEVSERWRAESKAAIAELAQHFQDKFRLMSWQEAIDLGGKNKFAARVQFLKSLSRGCFQGENAARLNEQHKIDLKPSINITAELARNFRRKTNAIVDLFYRNYMPMYVKNLVSHELINEKLREILFAESILRTLLPFQFELYPGLPNIAEEITMHLFVTDNMTPYVIGTEEDVRAWTEEIRRRNPIKKTSDSDEEEKRAELRCPSAPMLIPPSPVRNDIEKSPRSSSWPLDKSSNSSSSSSAAISAALKTDEDNPICSSATTSSTYRIKVVTTTTTTYEFSGDQKGIHFFLQQIKGKEPLPSSQSQTVVFADKNAEENPMPNLK